MSAVSADELLYEEERGPSTILRLQFRGASRPDDEEKRLMWEMIEGVVLKHDAKRWVESRA